MELTPPELTAVQPSLWAPLNRRSRGTLLHVWDGAQFEGWSWGEWQRRSLEFAGALRAQGVRPGDRVACLLTNSPASCAGVLGVWFAGGCLVSLPLISRAMALPAYAAMLKRIVAAAEPMLLLCSETVLQHIEGADLGVRVAAFEQLDGPLPVEATPPGDSEVAFVQFSSGSTTEPRGCMLTARAIAWQLESLARALAIDPDRDTGAAWLPLAHDMGLFGCLLLSYWTGHPIFLSSPERFLRDPSSWLTDCGRFRVTVSATPNFGLDIASRVAHIRAYEPIPMRRVVVGGERIDASTLQRAHSSLGPHGITRERLVSAYGLAEATLAVTMSPVGRAPRILYADGETPAEDNLREADGSRISPHVSAGPPLPGNTVSIGGDEMIGEIVVRTPSLAEGYLGDREATNARFTDDGLMTGDLGFLHAGELFVTGRVGDLMCVAGRNVYARDLEAAIAGIPGVRAGGYTVVDIERLGATRLVAVVELRQPHPDMGVIAAQIKRRTRAALGVAVDDCLFIPRGQLPKTPSGKVQRWRCRELVLDRAT